MYKKKAEVNTEVEKLKSAIDVMTQIKSTTKSMQELAESTNRIIKYH